jgi:hypothetical protein
MKALLNYFGMFFLSLTLYTICVGLLSFVALVFGFGFFTSIFNEALACYYTIATLVLSAVVEFIGFAGFTYNLVSDCIRYSKVI